MRKTLFAIHFPTNLLDNNLMDQIESFLKESKYYITEVYKLTVHSDWSNYVAYFPYNRIYYVVDGEAVLHLKDRDLRLEKGKCYFIPAFQIVSGECNDYMTHFYIHFHNDSIINNIFQFYKFNYEINAEGSEKWLIEKLYENYKSDTLYSKILSDGLFKVLLSEFLKDADIQNTNVFKFIKILDYINEHIYEDINIRDLSKIMCLDNAYFINIFKKTFGLSPLQYILSKKIQLAQLMLAKDNNSISEIAAKLGFENEIYFYRLFKKKTGLSPSEYRRTCRKN